MEQPNVPLGSYVAPGDQEAFDEWCRGRVAGERMMRWFEYAHLPIHLQGVSMLFYNLAAALCVNVEPGPERTVAFRKLLEAKDAAVRAAIDSGL